MFLVIHLNYLDSNADFCFLASFDNVLKMKSTLEKRLFIAHVQSFMLRLIQRGD